MSLLVMICHCCRWQSRWVHTTSPSHS